MIDITVDIDHLKTDLSDISERQIPFALALAINRTADEALAAVKQSLPEHFTIRNERFVNFLFKRTQTATKANPAATIAITGPKASIFTKHETGGDFTASPDHPFYVPTAALRAAPPIVIPKAMYPKALRLEERRDIVGTLPAKSTRTKRGKVQIQGKRRTFVIDSKSTGTGMAYGIFQRYGPGKHDIRMLWRYTLHVHLPPRLHFEQTTKRVVDERFALNFDGMMAYAQRTAN